jgi:DNA invertase Pin-like site-specific DNA recombinase
MFRKLHGVAHEGRRHHQAKEAYRRNRNCGCSSSPISLDEFPDLSLASAYARVSAHQSNPKSLTDQISACSRRARSDGRFIPLDYIHADFAWTGRYPRRRGYQSFKALLEDPAYRIEAAYIDDFFRCGRILAEWGRFAAKCTRLEIALISVEQGIDFTDKSAQAMIAVFGLVSNLQLQSVQANVRRGIKGTIERGGFVGHPPFGYGRTIVYDDHGRPKIGAKGKVLRKLCVDPETGPILVEMFERFTEQNWPLKAIVEDLNQRLIEGWDGQNCTTAKRRLRNCIALGVWVNGTRTRQFDDETEEYRTKLNPAEQVISTFDPDLQIISTDLWLRTQQKLDDMRKKHPNTGRAPSRNEICPTTLFNGTLFCFYCDGELTLLRSAGIQQQMCCPRGRDRRCGCKLRSSKSVIAIEECLLGHIRDSLLTDAAIDHLVKLTNRVLEEESTKPLPDEKPLRQKERQLRTQIARLNTRVAECDDRDAAKSLVVTLGKRQRELERLLPQLRAADSRVRLRTTRITREAVVQALQDIRGLMNEDKKVAGLAIRELTGPIRVRQDDAPGTKNKSRWIAEFTAQYGGILRRVLDADDDAVRLIQSSLPDTDNVTVIIEPNFRKPKRKIPGRDKQGHFRLRTSLLRTQ